MAKGIPPPPAPPPPKTNTSSAGAAFNAFINAHPNMRPYADRIWKWAGTYGVDKVVAAGLFWRESFAEAKRLGVSPDTITSSAGAVGIGQIMPLHVGEKTPWGHTVTQSDLVNPDFNVRWSMWYFSQQQAKYGSPDAAYAQGYNPGYTGPALTSLLPKGYVPRAGLSPTDRGTVTAETSAATAAAKAQAFEKWAVLDAKGHVQYVNIVDPAKPPKNILTVAGRPLTRSSYNDEWEQLRAIEFYAYTGRYATGKEIKAILENPVSIYMLRNQLAGNVPGPVKNTTFQKSPVWKQHAAGLVEIARQALGENWKPSGGIIRKAIAGGWDQATFQAKVKELPAYLKGPEFQTTEAQHQQVFESIYGKADAGARTLIQETALQGWSTAEFASWLRQQDAYKHTPEYQSKQVSFLSALGLITGQQPTATAAPNTTPPKAAGPNSKRIPGQGSLGSGTGLVVNGG